MTPLLIALGLRGDNAGNADSAVGAMARAEVMWDFGLGGRHADRWMRRWRSARHCESSESAAASCQPKAPTRVNAFAQQWYREHTAMRLCRDCLASGWTIDSAAMASGMVACRIALRGWPWAVAVPALLPHGTVRAPVVRLRRAAARTNPVMQHGRSMPSDAAAAEPSGAAFDRALHDRSWPLTSRPGPVRHTAHSVQNNGLARSDSSSWLGEPHLRRPVTSGRTGRPTAADTGRRATTHGATNDVRDTRRAFSTQQRTSRDVAGVRVGREQTTTRDLLRLRPLLGVSPVCRASRLLVALEAVATRALATHFTRMRAP